MTVPLTANFFKNARGITFRDGGGITWTFNKNTNELTATGAGGAGIGTVTSVGLADGSSVPIFGISGSPVIAAGTLTFTLNTQTQKTFFAGPTSGANAQPTFRVIAAADVPALAYVTSVALADGSTAPIYTINGSPVTASGTLTFTLATQTQKTFFAGPTSGAAAQPTFRAIAAADVPALAYVTSVALADGSSSPIYTITGSPVTASGTLTFTLATQTANKVFAGPTSGGAAQPTFRVLVAADVPSSILPGSFSGFANPSGLIGMTAVNGVATTADRSDSTHAIDPAIAPSWTGTHTWTVAGNALVINAPAGGNSVKVVGTSGHGCFFETVDGNAGLQSWLFGGAITAAKNFQVYDNINAVLMFDIHPDSVAANRRIAFFAAAGTAQVTGFGTPTNLSKVSGFTGTAATLAQCGGMISQIVTDLKALGLYAA